MLQKYYLLEIVFSFREEKFSRAVIDTSGYPSTEIYDRQREQFLKYSFNVSRIDEGGTFIFRFVQPLPRDRRSLDRDAGAKRFQAANITIRIRRGASTYEIAESAR